MAIFCDDAHAFLSVIHDQDLNFGKTVKASSGNVRVIVNRNGNLGGGTTAKMLDTSSLSTGSDRIVKRGNSGSNNISISFEECATNSNIGLRLRRFRARYDGFNFVDNAGNLPAPSNGVGNSKTLEYGATLVINSTASIGIQHPCYYIDINYE